jgi:hypothetical protein
MTMRIAALNNYPLDKMVLLAEAGEIPRQHAWGLDALSNAGHLVEAMRYQEPGNEGFLARTSLSFLLRRSGERPRPRYDELAASTSRCFRSSSRGFK